MRVIRLQSFVMTLRKNPSESMTLYFPAVINMPRDVAKLKEAIIQLPKADHYLQLLNNWNGSGGEVRVAGVTIGSIAIGGRTDNTAFVFPVPVANDELAGAIDACAEKGVTNASNILRVVLADPEVMRAGGLTPVVSALRRAAPLPASAKPAAPMPVEEAEDEELFAEPDEEV